MRKVLSASLAGTALLAFSILVGSGSDTHPSDASRRCDYTACGRACRLGGGFFCWPS